jgi:hypothetical protein
MHVDLLFLGRSDIPVVGFAFLLSALGGTILALSVLLVPLQLLVPVTLLGALFIPTTFGTLLHDPFGLPTPLGGPLSSAAVIIDLVSLAGLTLAQSCRPRGPTADVFRVQRNVKQGSPDS